MITSQKMANQLKVSGGKENLVVDVPENPRFTVDSNGLSYCRRGEDVTRLQWEDIINVKEGVKQASIIVSTNDKKIEIFCFSDDDYISMIKNEIERRFKKKEEKIAKHDKVEFVYPDVLNKGERRGAIGQIICAPILMILLILQGFLKDSDTSFELSSLSHILGRSIYIIEKIINNFSDPYICAATLIFLSVICCMLAFFWVFLSIGVTRLRFLQKRNKIAPLILSHNSISLCSGTCKERCIPFTEIVSIDCNERCMEIKLASGERLKINEDLSYWELFKTELRQRLETAGIKYSVNPSFKINWWFVIGRWVLYAALIVIWYTTILRLLS